MITQYLHISPQSDWLWGKPKLSKNSEFLETLYNYINCIQETYKKLIFLAHGCLEGTRFSAKPCKGNGPARWRITQQNHAQRANAASFDERIWQNMDRNGLPWFLLIWQVHVTPISGCHMAFKDHLVWFSRWNHRTCVTLEPVFSHDISNWASILAASRRCHDPTDPTPTRWTPTHTERVPIRFTTESFEVLALSGTPASPTLRNRCTWRHQTQRIQGALQMPENDQHK